MTQYHDQTKESNPKHLARTFRKSKLAIPGPRLVDPLDLVISRLDSRLLVTPLTAIRLLLTRANLLETRVPGNRRLDQRRLFREEARQQTIAYKRAREAPDIEHVVDVLCASDTFCEAWVDLCGHAGDVGDDGDEECDNGAPVSAGFVVPVAAAGLVEGGDVDVLALDDPVVGTHDCGDGGEEDAQTRHEGEEGRGGVNDLPGDHDPGCCDCGDDHTAADVDVFWEEGGHVVGTGDDVGGQVGTDLSNDPGEADEECSCAA